MPRALLMLLRMRAWAIVRKILRPGSTKRLLVTIVGIALVGIWLLPSVLAATTTTRAKNPEAVLLVAPLILAALCLLPALLSGNDASTGAAAGGKGGALAFTPAEIDLLFPGPFSRRQLLAFKLLALSGPVLVMSLLFSAFFLRFAGSWPAAFLASLTTLTFVQLFSTAVSLLRLRVAESMYTRVRLALLAVTVLALTVLGYLVYQDVKGFDPRAVVLKVRSYPAVNALLWPFEVYIRALVAQDFTGLFKWLGIGWAINAALLGLVFRLDADYLEASIAAGQRRHERMQRLRAGGVWSASISARSARRKLPMPPRLGGAGPLIWRQGTGALRGARSAITIILIGGIMMTVMYHIGRPPNPPPPPPGVDPAILPNRSPAPAGIVAFILVWMTMMLAGTFRFDFRADLDHIDTLKSLPISSGALSAGQMAVPVAVIGAMQMVVVAVLGLVGAIPPLAAVLIAAGAPLATFLWLAADNFVFLLAPTRPPTGAIDFQAVGRQAVLMLAKAAMFGITGGIVGLAAWGTYAASGGSWIATGITGWLALLAISAMMLKAIAWAFERLDPSVDLPG